MAWTKNTDEVGNVISLTDDYGQTLWPLGDGWYIDVQGQIHDDPFGPAAPAADTTMDTKAEYDAIYGAGAYDAEAKRYAELDASGQLGSYESLYGEYPESNPEQWFADAWAGGQATQIKQDIASDASDPIQSFMDSPALPLSLFTAGMGATGGWDQLFSGGQEFLGAGVDPVTAADAAAGTSMYGTGAATGGAMNLSDIIEEMGNFTGGDYVPETTLGDASLGAFYGDLGIGGETAGTGGWASLGGGVDPSSTALGGTIAGGVSASTALTAANAIKNILANGGSTDDWMKVIGALGPAALGALGSYQQSGQLSDLARQQLQAEQSRYEDIVKREQERFGVLTGREDAAIARQQAAMEDLLRREQERFVLLTGREDAAIKRQLDAIEYGRAQGAPFRDRYSALEKDPSSYLSSPEVQAAVGQGTNALARSLSAKVGNPIENPTALGDLQGYATNTLFGKLGEEKNRLAQLGWGGPYGSAGATIPGIGTSLPSGVSGPIPGIGTSLTGTPSTGSNTLGTGVYDASKAATGADSNLWNSLGLGLQRVFDPQPTSLADLLKSLSGSGMFAVK